MTSRVVESSAVIWHRPSVLYKNLDYWESKFVQVQILILSNLKSYKYQTYDQKCKNDIYVIIKEIKWNELIKHIFRLKSLLLTVTWMYYNKENKHMYMYMVLGTTYLLSLHRYKYITHYT